MSTQANRDLHRKGSDRSHARRIGDGWGAASRRVVIGLVDAEVAGRLAQLFGGFSILPTLVFTCEQLAQEAREDSYGLIVLDSRFICEHDSRCLQEVREASAAPILAVGDPAVEDHDEVDIALDVQDGLKEILQRGTALIDLSRPVRLPHSLRLGSLELDVQRHQAWWKGRELPLTTLEFRIMEVLALAGGSVVTDSELSRRVWSHSSFDDADRLAAHIRRIRRKGIETDPSQPEFLLRVRGRGYRLATSPSSQSDK